MIPTSFEWMRRQLSHTGTALKVLIVLHLLMYFFAIAAFQRIAPEPVVDGPEIVLMLAIFFLMFLEAVTLVCAGFMFSMRGLSFFESEKRAAAMGAILGLIESTKGFLYPALAASTPGKGVPEITGGITLFLLLKGFYYILILAVVAAVLVPVGFGIHRIVKALSPTEDEKPLPNPGNPA